MPKNAIIKMMTCNHFRAARRRRRAEVAELDENSTASSLRPLVVKIARYGAVLSAAAFTVTLIWGFSLRTLVGFIAGYVIMCLSMMYLSRTCERAVSLDTEKAKRLMRKCYMLRFFGLFAVCAAAMLTKAVNVVGVLVPQFFPRIILTIDQIISRKEDSHE